MQKAHLAFFYLFTFGYIKLGRAQVMNYENLFLCFICNEIKIVGAPVRQRRDPHSYHKQRDFSLEVQLKLLQTSLVLQLVWQLSWISIFHSKTATHENWMSVGWLALYTMLGLKHSFLIFFLFNTNFYLDT